MRKALRKVVAMAIVIMMISSIGLISVLAADSPVVATITNSLDQTGDINKGLIPDTTVLAPGQVITNKSVEDLGGGEFEITLEAIGRRFDIEEVREEPIQYDIVFVLDYSTSMGSGTSSKLARLQSAALTSINSMLANNTSEFYNRIAVVGYGLEAARLTGSSTSNAWIGTGGVRAISGSTLNNPFSGTQYTNIMSGMNLAQQILAGRGTTTRVPIIVLMTDGQPNLYYTAYNNFTNTGSANRQTTGSGTSFGTYANENAAYYTIMNMLAVKNSIANLQLFSIGFDLDSVSASTTSDTATDINGLPVQRAFAYATINPSASNLARTTGGAGDNRVNSAVSSAMSSLKNKLGTGFVNPVDEFQNAVGSNLENITKAFITITETINNNDPIIGNIVLTDKIDSAFEIIPGTFRINGADAVEIPSGVAISGNTLTWSFKNLETLAPAHPTGIIGDHARNSLSFKVKVTDATLANDTIAKSGDRVYTNTANFNDNSSANPNFAKFNPLSKNPFYYAGGTAKNGTAADGSVTQRLFATGWATIKQDTTYDIPDVNGIVLSLTKYLTQAEGTMMPSASTFTFNLYTAETGGTPIATLILSDVAQEASGQFVWAEGTNFDEITGTLYLEEIVNTSYTNGWWVGSIGGKSLSNRVPFVSLSLSGDRFERVYLNGQDVINEFHQQPTPVTVTLNKHFAGDTESFEALHQFDISFTGHKDECYELILGSNYIFTYGTSPETKDVQADSKEQGDTENTNAGNESNAVENTSDNKESAGNEDSNIGKDSGVNEDSNTVKESGGNEDSNTVKDSTVSEESDNSKESSVTEESNNTEDSHSNDSIEDESNKTFVGAEVVEGNYEYVLKADCGCDEESINDKYSFTFTLLDKNGTDIAVETISLTAAQILSLMKSDEAAAITFEIPVAFLNNGPFSIRESEVTYTGWSTANDSTGINVPVLGGANGFSVERSMTNNFGGFKELQEIEFSKTVINNRTADVDNYTGSFTFNLSGNLGSTAINTTQTLQVQNGVGNGFFRLKGLLNASGTLFLSEVSGSVDGMTYDDCTYELTIVDGEITAISSSAQEKGMMFTNLYEEPILPVLEIVKFTTDGAPVEEFVFQISGDINDTITINGAGEAQIELPYGFTGEISVSEIPGTADGWEYDGRTHTFSFVNGLRVDLEAGDAQLQRAVAIFENNYEKPEVPTTPEEPKTPEPPEPLEIPKIPETPQTPEVPQVPPTLNTFYPPVVPESNDEAPVGNEPAAAAEAETEPVEDMMIEDEEVPLAAFELDDAMFEEPFEMPQEQEFMEIEDENIPLSMMPQTGIGGPIGALALGLALSVLTSAAMAVEIKKLIGSAEENKKD